MNKILLALSLVGFLLSPACGALHPLSPECQEREVSSVKKVQCDQEAAVAKSYQEPGFMRAGGH